MNALKLNRILRGWSQQQLAGASGISQTNYSRIERHVRSATAAERQRIAAVMELPVAVAFGDEGTQAPRPSSSGQVGTQTVGLRGDEATS